MAYTTSEGLVAPEPSDNISSTGVDELQRAVNTANTAIAARSKIGHGHTTSQISDFAQVLADALAPKANIEAVELAEGTDLNNVITPGVYYESVSAQAAAGQNFPEALAGVLTVTASVSRNHVQQQYITYGSSSRYYIRGRYSSSWAQWRQLVTSDDPRLTDARPPTEHNHDGRYYTQAQMDERLESVLEPTDLDLEDLNTVLEDGWYVQIGSGKASTELNYPVNKAGLLEVTSRPGDYMVYQRYTTYEGNDAFWRAKYGDTWYPWQESATAAELDAALALKSDVGHTHEVADVDGLEARLWERPALPAGTDLDTLKEVGYHPVGPTQGPTLINAPPEPTTGIIEVFKSTTETYVQWYYYTGGGYGSKVFTRRTLSGSANTWMPWLQMYTEADAVEDAWERPDLAQGADLNTITEPGVYDYSKSREHLNGPDFVGSGVLEVLATPNAFMQRISFYGGSGTESRVWVRRLASVATGAWSPWRELATTAQLAEMPVKVHGHEIVEVDGLGAALDSKAAVEAVELPGEVDLNTIDTPGVYYQSLTAEAQSGANYPVASAGVLVVTANASRNHVHQRFFPGGSATPTQFIRVRYAGTWTAWVDISGQKGDRGPEGPYGGTEVTDPQITALVQDTETELHDVLEAAYRRSVSVTETGAAGDGLTDDTAAVQAALARDRVTYVPEGTYRMTGTLQLPEGSVLRMAPGAVLDFSEHTAVPHIRSGGSISSARRAVTGGATIGSLELTVDPAGFEAEGWVRVASDDLFDPGNTDISLGELVQVREVTETGLVLWTPLLDDYATAPTVQPAAMIRGAHIEGGTVRGNFEPQTGMTGVLLELSVSPRITGTRFEGIDDRHISIDSCVDARLRDLDIYWAYTTGTAYAVSFLNMTRDSYCTASRFRYVRHALSTNNVTSGDRVGVVRRVEFSHCTVEASSRAIGGSMGGGDAIDTHGAAEDMRILHNTVNGSTSQGINVECRSATVSGNLILYPSATGIAVTNQTSRPGFFVVTDNVVRGAGAGWYGIAVRPGSRGALSEHKGIVVANNLVTDGFGGGIIVGSTTTDLADETVTVTGNSVHNCAGTAFYLLGIDSLVESGNIATEVNNGLSIRQVRTASCGPSTIKLKSDVAGNAIYLYDVAYSRIQPGGVEALAGTGLRIDATCKNLSVGPISHIRAQIPLANNADTSVVLA